MGHKIFISYKYGDTSVKHLERTPWYESTKVRHYYGHEIEMYTVEQGEKRDKRQ